jgi:hypothetical protein
MTGFGFWRRATIEELPGRAEDGGMTRAAIIGGLALAP